MSFPEPPTWVAHHWCNEHGYYDDCEVRRAGGSGQVVTNFMASNVPAVLTGELMHEVLSDVQDERERQIVKWGGPEGDGVENPLQSNYVRLRVLAEEFGEVAEAMGRPEDGNGKGDLRKELIQVAAVAVAWVEGLDDYAAGKGTCPNGHPTWRDDNFCGHCAARLIPLKSPEDP